jgi:hypothetical protein
LADEGDPIESGIEPTEMIAGVDALVPVELPEDGNSAETKPRPS